MMGAMLVAWVLVGTSDKRLMKLGEETAKFTIQLVLVGVAGSVLTQEYNRGRAKREASNEFRKLTMRSLSRAYSDTKKVRRMLRARCVAAPGELDPGMPSLSYDEFMERINNTQIELEILKRELKVFRDAFGRSAALWFHLNKMEDYLGRLVDEYETSRRDFGASECRALSSLPVLQEFLAKAPAGDFRAGFARHFRAAMAIFEQERLKL